MTTHTYGRRVNHDPRARFFAHVPPSNWVHKPVRWDTAGHVLNQGDVGACVLYTAAAYLNTVPLYTPGTSLATGDDALGWYEETTGRDPYPGQWFRDGRDESEDTGTDMTSAAKTLRKHGLIRAFSHALGLDATLASLQTGPVAVGLQWVTGMERPTLAADGNGGARAVMHLDGETVSGHETLLVADNAEDAVLVLNSWGPAWPDIDAVKRGDPGRAWMPYDVLRDRLAHDGDAMILHK